MFLHRFKTDLISSNEAEVRRPKYLTLYFKPEFPNTQQNDLSHTNVIIILNICDQVATSDFSWIIKIVIVIIFSEFYHTI